MDYAALSSQILRALRGRRSQTSFSKRLKYKSNIVYSWESGKAFPSAARALWAAQRVGVDVPQALASFLRTRPVWLEREPDDFRRVLTELLAELKGRRTIVELAGLSGFSRYAIARWLKGAAEPRLPEFLRLVEVCTLRLLDFVAQLVDPELLPVIKPRWLELEAARRATYQEPWTQAVLRVLELPAYAAFESHPVGWVASRLQLTVEQEQKALDLLVQTKQIRRVNQRLEPTGEVRTIDTRRDPAAARQLREFWLQVALERLQQGSHGLFAHNVFNVSQQDYERLQELQKTYFAEVRSIVAQSAPEERVVLLNLQLMALDDSARRSKANTEEI